MSKSKTTLLVSLLFLTLVASSPSIAIVPKNWSPLTPVLLSRYEQIDAKMKLSEAQVNSIIRYLTDLKTPTPELTKLQYVLPKTTLELLRSIQLRGVDLSEAEKMAVYMQGLVTKFQFRQINKFDENTSHIIGREWPEIDYSGENMTWEAQRLKYMPYGIEDFKSAEQLARFFPIEAKLPYFNKTYQPLNLQN